MADLITSLKQFDLFSGLSTAEIESLIKIGTPKSFTAGQALLKESDTGDEIFFILDGRVNIMVFLLEERDREIIAILKPGEIVGESVLLGKQRRSAYVVAKDDVRVLVWRKEQLLKLLEQDKNIGYLLMKNIALDVAYKLEAANQTIKNYLMETTNIIM